MKDPINAYMKLGTVHHVSYPLPPGSEEIGKLFTLKKLLCDTTFDAIEVGHFADPAVRAQAVAMVRTAHLETVAYGGQGILLGSGLSINALDEQDRTRAVTALKEGIDEAYEFGASLFAFLAGRYETESVERSMQALMRSIRELSAYTAERGGMGIEIEVFDYDIDKCSLIGPIDRVTRLAEELCPELPNFSIQVDSSHIPLLRESIRESITPIASVLRHAHIGNAVMRDTSSPAYGDLHPRFGYPHGENDTEQLAEYLRVLLDVGFLNERDRPLVSFEVKPQPGEDPDLVLANAKRTLRQAWLNV